MATLNSPGVSVSVIDESLYTPAAPGTTPLIIIASEESKQNGTGTGTASGTLASTAGQVYIMTSQKDLLDTFGTPVFKTDANNNPIHAGEQNEYGLQAAYSYLGVSNRAYVVRANINLGQLNAKSAEPTGAPANGTFWFDTANTQYGVFEWNSAASTTTGGQTFTVKYPTVITDLAKVDDSTDGPKLSIGSIGDYAIVAVSTLNTLWYKKGQTVTGPAWVEVGTADWVKGRPTAVGSLTNTNWTAGSFTITTATGTATVTSPASLAALVTTINAGGTLGAPLLSGVSAAAINGKLEIYSTGTSVSLVDTTTGPTPNKLVARLGLLEKTYVAPLLRISAHTSVPSFKRTDFDNTVVNGAPTGSVWVKTTQPNLGARWRIKVYNSSTGAWVEQATPLYATNHDALAGIDPVGAGINLALGSSYVQYNTAEETPSTANFKLFVRNGVGATTITADFKTNPFASGNPVQFTIRESLKGSAVLANPVTISFTTSIPGNPAATPPTLTTYNTATQNAELLVSLINNAGFINIKADYNSNTKIVTISHVAGGDFRINDLSANSTFASMFAVGTTARLYRDPSDAGNVAKYLASLWTSTVNGVGVAVSSPTAPTSIAVDGTLWYSSITDEVDLMVHNGTTWVGYLNYVQNQGGGSTTDPAGPIVRATKPTKQSTGANLANGDLWIDTSNLEKYPTIYKYNYSTMKWVLVNTADQTTEDGIIFADVRWNTTGRVASASSIIDLLTSNFADFDTPDPALYPKGMLLWNLRRSGFNIKKFVQNYVNILADNKRQTNESMSTYYPHRWVSQAANQVDGSGTFGRKSQRAVVVQALQSLVNSNQQIRDDESRVFNLLACPGYPELVGELIALNYDRGLTAFIVGDTPARLAPDATTLSNWGTNQNLAVEDGDNGLVSSDEYLGFFYPWGFTSDNLGNNIVVPPSHMMLRTIALSDNVSYPWFAPAGTRRGGITNATAVGYITSEGEFSSVALNTGQRDVLQQQCKVNPITFITGTGLVNYGQLTRAKTTSSLDRINVARLVINLRRQFAVLAKPYVFEPNDKITRDEIKGAAESLLLELVGQRALYDYLVVCDSSNNTPARIDRNELYLDVAIEPVKAVEFIYIPLRLKNTGEIKSLK